MAYVYRARRGFTLSSSVDAYGRRYGFCEERFNVRQRANPDRNTIIQEALVASVDSGNDDSVAGSTLVNDQPHPYFDGSSADRPLAKVVGQGVVEEVNSGEAVIWVRWQTQYLSSSGSGPGEITNGVTKRFDVDVKDVDIFQRFEGADGDIYKKSSDRRNVTVSRYYLQYTSDDLPNLPAIQADENKLSTPPFLGGRKVLFQGAQVTPFQGQFIVTEMFMDISDLKELTIDDLGGPDWTPVPAIPGLGDWSVGEDPVTGAPIYTVRQPEARYEEIPPPPRWSS